MDPLRDRVFGLLSDLCGPTTDVTPDGLRLLSHTILGVSRDHSPVALFAVRDALPWVAALVELSDGAQPESVAQMLTGHGIIRGLGPAALVRRLAQAGRPRATIGSTDLSDEAGRLSRVLRDLAMLDTRLVDLSMQSDSVIRRTVLDDPALLAATGSVCAEMQTEVATRLRDALYLVETTVDPAPLEMLADLEGSWDGGMLRTRQGFGERTRRFEISACDHLRQSGFAPAVRVALLYGGQRFTESELRHRIHEFPIFADDRPLEDLAVVLCQQRGNVLAHLRGEVPLRALDGWVSYLRGACHELAETRDISIRESTSFAHFCLHLTNFCDLAVATDDATNDEARRAVMNVEDELKEFALLGQRAGLSDDEAGLGQYEASRWSDASAEEELVERLGRLGGGWRAGFAPTAGGVTRLGTEALDPWYGALSAFDNLEHLERLMPRLAGATIRGANLFETARPRRALHLLLMALAAATEETTTLDFEPAVEWFTDPERRQLAESMIDVSQSVESSGCGFVAEPDGPTVRVSVKRHAEFEALLTLVNTPQLPGPMVELAHQRIEALVANRDGESVGPVAAPGAWINA